MLKKQNTHILTVSELTQAIKQNLEYTFPQVVLKGEISNFKVQQSGHLYFSLKDDAAQIACVMFHKDTLSVQVPLKGGDQVVIKGELTVFAAKGNYQIVVREISLLGIGELLARLEQLKQKLHQEGLFDSSKKKALPQFPRCIGVVTSPTGAVIRDIIHVLTRRLKKFHLILNPVRVQGEGAADEIARAIDEMNHFFPHTIDVMIVGRGGGSLEDLMPFNDEKVARAISRSKIPIISAVGHETDVTIADFVADVRAPTPSAAAEIVSCEVEALSSTLEKYRRHIHQEVLKSISRAKQDIRRIARMPFFTSPLPLLGPTMQRLDDYRERLDDGLKRLLDQKKEYFIRLKKQLESQKPHRRVQENKVRLETLVRGIDGAVKRLLGDARRRFTLKNFLKEIHARVGKDVQRKKERLALLSSHLTSVNPKTILSKGYSICLNQKDGTIISSVAFLTPGQEVRLLVSDGEAEAQITQIVEKRS